MKLKISETALISAEQSRQAREQQVNSLALRLRAERKLPERQQNKKLLARFSLREQRSPATSH